jgi:integrase
MLLNTDDLKKWLGYERTADVVAWLNRHKVPYRIPYTLRHTRAAELLSQGASVPLAAKQLGHSVQMFLGTYSEYLEAYSDEDIRALDGKKVREVV